MESKSTIFPFLKNYLKPFSIQIIIILISIFIISSSILGLGYALKYLIDKGFAEHSLLGLNKAFLTLLSMVLILAFASYSRSLRVNWICQQIEENIKKDAYKNIISISPSYFEHHKISDVLSRLSNDLTLLSNSIMMIASYSLRNLVMAIGGLALLLYTSIKLTSYVLIMLPIIIIPLIIIGRKTKKLSKENQQDIALCNAHLEETMSFLKIIQAYNREFFEYKRFVDLINKAQIIAKNRIKLRSLLFSLVIGLILSSVALVLWIGGRDVLNGVMSPGELSSFVFYAILVAASIGSLSEVFSDWQRAAGALERIIEIMNIKSDLIETSKPKTIPNEFDLSFVNLSFSYPTRPNIKVLDNVNFIAKHGETVALVGPSGAGKSTIFHLLLRFADTNEGSIELNEIDIKNFKLSELREQFAFVSQEPAIFSGTAYENIIYGNLEASEQQVIQAAKDAEIFDFLQSLPDGLNSYIGEKGVKLSGGQKQRIAIARAILRNPKILLLDEATSSLDTENEKLVQTALDRLRSNRTTLIIAHRFSTFSTADKIVLLEKGKILAQGTHKELLNNNDLYKRLCH